MPNSWHLTMVPVFETRLRRLSIFIGGGAGQPRGTKPVQTKKFQAVPGSIDCSMIGKIVIVLAVAVALLLGLSQSPHWSNTEFGADSIPPWERSASMPAIIAPSSGVFDLTQVDVPKPGVGQILVKVQAAPVNPSDVYQASVATTYTGSAAFPRPLGLEGSGHVVASGGGPLAHLYSVLGVRVGFATFHGTWRVCMLAWYACLHARRAYGYTHASVLS